MLKTVPRSDKTDALIAKAYGDTNIDPSGLSVFEAVYANTTPLRRRNGIYAGAHLQPDVFAEMV